jgi:hypothetical protein
MPDFGSVEEMISYLRAEADVPEDFVTRFILVQGCLVWDELVPRLEYESDQVIRLSQFCSGPDVFPDLTRLSVQLEQILAIHKRVLVVPVAECVRLSPAMGEIIRSLAEIRSTRNCRVYVPLLAGEEMLDEQVRRLARYRAGLLPEFWAVAGNGDCEVIVAPFLAHTHDRRVARGIQDYLRLWERESLSRIWLVTSLAPWLPSRYMRVECRVRLYPSSYDYVSRVLGMDGSTQEQGTPEQWEWLASLVLEGDSLDSLASRVLNIAGFDAGQVFSHWQSADARVRWLMWLWSKARSVHGTYMRSVVDRTSCVDDLPQAAVMEVFSQLKVPSTAAERQGLLKALGVRSMPHQFWLKYQELLDPVEKLAALSGVSEEERVEIVRCVAKLDGVVPREQWWHFLEITFPLLAWYLDSFSTGNEFIDHYFGAYRTSRVTDSPSEELLTLVASWAADQMLWGYPSRGEVLAKISRPGARIMWIDGLGIEWAGLMHHIITSQPGINCSISYARSQVPTTTEENSEWVGTDSPDRILDDIAHHYEYCYPLSFVKQLEAVEAICMRVIDHLSHGSTVIIASDHGLSRFAAKSLDKIDSPPGARVVAPGRYAELDVDSGMNSHAWIVDKGKAILLTHTQFSGGGARRGEIHGGATPEEVLIPLIIAQRTDPNVALSFELSSGSVRTNVRGEGVLVVKANRRTNSLQLRVSGRSISGDKRDDLTWSFNLKGLTPNRYTGSIYCDGQRVASIAFTVTRGIIEDDMGIKGGL